MADNADVLKAIARKEGVSYPVLTPNIKVGVCILYFETGTLVR
jgi:hypothetical protein